MHACVGDGHEMHAQLSFDPDGMMVRVLILICKHTVSDRPFDDWRCY